MRDIRAELAKEVGKKYQDEITKDKRVINTVAIIGVIIAALYGSKYVINALSGTVKACKNLKRAIKS